MDVFTHKRILLYLIIYLRAAPRDLQSTVSNISAKIEMEFENILSVCQGTRWVWILKE